MYGYNKRLQTKNLGTDCIEAFNAICFYFRLPDSTKTILFVPSEII